MAIKVKAKDADTLEEELEEWSLGVNLVNTAPTQTKETVTFNGNTMTLAHNDDKEGVIAITYKKM